MGKPLVDAEFLMQRMPGKGGWTFIVVPRVEAEQKSRSMWIKVKGTIDRQPFENLGLAPIKNGGHFFPVKAEIRKLINKQAGDYVQLVLFEDFSKFESPKELLDCLELEPGALEKFIRLTEGKQKEFVNWIYQAKKDETRAQRINVTIDKLLRNESLYDKNGKI